MDILAQKRVLFVLILIFFICGVNSGWASEIFPGFGLSKIKYFDDVSSKTMSSELFTSDELWGDVRFSVNGDVHVVYPPHPVMEFLDSPSVMTGKRYLEWNAARLEKFSQAQQVLEKL